MMQAQKGFTLIELVVVIVILGILAATALPKFIDLSGQAGSAAASGVAAAISSATAINYAGRKAGSLSAVAITSPTPCTTTVLSNFIQGVTLQNSGTPTNNNTYTVSGGSTCASNDGNQVQCSVLGMNGTAATAFVTCAN